MNRKLLIAVLFLTMALLVFTLSSFAAGRADSTAKANHHPLMSGEFAHMPIASAGLRAPSIFVPSDHWGTGPAHDRHPRLSLRGSAA
jgi:hypothetical protein